MDGILLQLPTLDTNTRWLIVIAAAMTIFYAVMRPIRGKKKDPLSRTSTRSPLAGERSVEREMSNLLVELSDMARQISGQLDNRALKLEMLIKEADERIAALRGAAGPSAKSMASDMVRELSTPAPISVPAPVAVPCDPRHLEIYEMADGGQSPPQIAQKLGRQRGEVELILALRQRPNA
ncbi:MAG TPA: hypothetical protein VFC78_04535 [Tepidisphaeraceae bacterium]|nr:hypothetical protein [Tepidisphaeraceae bacterium]